MLKISAVSFNKKHKESSNPSNKKEEVPPRAGWSKKDIAMGILGSIFIALGLRKKKTY